MNSLQKIVPGKAEIHSRRKIIQISKEVKLFLYALEYEKKILNICQDSLPLPLRHCFFFAAEILNPTQKRTQEKVGKRAVQTAAS